MEIGTFLWIIAACAVVGTGALAYTIPPLIIEIRATIAAVHNLMNRLEPDLAGLTHDARRIGDDAATLSGSIVKQKQSVDTAIATVGHSVGYGYVQAKHWLSGALGGARKLLGGGHGGSGDGR